jgi:hypothetical protein
MQWTLGQLARGLSELSRRNALEVVHLGFGNTRSQSNYPIDLSGTLFEQSDIGPLDAGGDHDQSKYSSQ